MHNNTVIPPRPLFILHKSDIDPTQALADTALALVQAGATDLCMVCHTAHFFLPGIRARLPAHINVVDMLALTALHCQRKGYKKVGLLATSATVETRIFHTVLHAHNIQLVCPGQASGDLQVGDQANIEAAIFGLLGIKTGYDNVRASQHAIANLRLLLVEALSLVQQLDVDCVVLGCTELPLVLNLLDIQYVEEACGGFDLDPGLQAVLDRLVLVNPTQLLADQVLKDTLLSRR